MTTTFDTPSSFEEDGTTVPPSRLGRNIAALGSSQVLTWIMSTASMLIIPRALGPSQMGAYAAAASAISILVLIAGFITADYLIQRMVVQRGQEANIVGAAVVLRAMTLPVLAGCTWLYVHLLGFQHSAWIFYFVGAAAATQMLTDPMQAAFRALERMDYLGVANVASTCATSITSIAVVLAGWKAVGLGASAAILGIVSLAANAWWIRHLGKMTFANSRRHLRPIARGGFSYWPQQLISVVYLYIDSVILSLMASSVVVGWYAASTKLFGTLLFIPTILTTAWYPRLIAAFELNTVKFTEESTSLLGLLPALGIPVAAATLVSAGPVLRLIYGPAYSHAIPVMMVLGLCAIPMYPGIGLGQVLVALRKPVILASIMLSGVAVNVGLNYLLIPLFAARYSNGAVGSASSLFVTELLITAGELAVVRSALGGLRIWRRVPKTLIATAALCAAGFAATPLGIAAPVLGVLAFVVTALLIRLLTDDELAALVSTAQKIGRALARRAASPTDTV